MQNFRCEILVHRLQSAHEQSKITIDKWQAASRLNIFSSLFIPLYADTIGPSEFRGSMLLVHILSSTMLRHLAAKFEFLLFLPFNIAIEFILDTRSLRWIRTANLRRRNVVHEQEYGCQPKPIFA